MLTLYDNMPSGNGYKARLVLAQLAIPYRRVELDIFKRETRTPEFLKKNPNGRIPTLALDDGTHLPESNAIIFYLADGTPLLPADRLLRAQVLQWMFFEQYSHEPNIATVRFWLHLPKLSEAQQAQLPAKREQGYAALDVMEDHLARNAYFVGGRYSIADVALYAYTHVAEEGGFDLGRFAAIKSWFKRVEGQPGHIPITQG
ncbi:MAG: glutathione S-transferase family protein [Proteobacteria bacterium]|nr:glutathione S-transferase family protein [Pseudomonadota bacterium]MBI3497806.1 glutathione S-transferase family protein [Pseudomonadota bacterium]